jgi:hypothetical protein
MNDKLKQCVMEMLRMGEDPDKVLAYIEILHRSMSKVKDYQPNHDVADFHRAWKDADFRP